MNENIFQGKVLPCKAYSNQENTYTEEKFPVSRGKEARNDHEALSVKTFTSYSLEPAIRAQDNMKYSGVLIQEILRNQPTRM